VARGRANTPVDAQDQPPRQPQAGAQPQPPPCHTPTPPPCQLFASAAIGDRGERDRKAVRDDSHPLVQRWTSGVSEHA
jgi:hypothetical protein